MPPRSNMTRIANRALTALVGGPVRAVLADALVLAAIVSWLGWFRSAFAAVLVLAWNLWSARRLPARWRPW